MLYLVTGGSGSGKSEYAENLAVSRHRNESEHAEKPAVSRHRNESEYAEKSVVSGHRNESEYAEKLAVSESQNGRLIYVATMYPYFAGDGKMDSETAGRIDRHRNMRQGKGFDTIECFTDISTLAVANNDVILLECMSNLLANEMYLDNGNIPYTPENSLDDMIRLAEEYIVKPLINIAKRTGDIIVVTNEVFSDGYENTYDEGTNTYIRLLGYINQRLAGSAESVTEVVCGIPVVAGK